MHEQYSSDRLISVNAGFALKALPDSKFADSEFDFGSAAVWSIGRSCSKLRLV